MTVSRLDTLTALAEAATPGPWRLEEDGNEGTPWVWPHGAFAADPQDTSFIAACSPDVVLALVRVARAAREAIRDQFEEGWFDVAPESALSAAEFELREALAALEEPA